MKYTLLIALLLIAAPIALADNHSTQYCDYLTEEIGMEVGDEVPGFVPYKNERVALFNVDAENQGHVITTNGEISSVGCESIENATYKVTVTSTETINAVFNSEKPLGEFDDQKAEGNVIVEGQTTGKKIKSSFAFAGVKVLSWFGL
jgi:hypothetical protein